MITLPTGQLPLKMKSLFPILGLSFLSLTLTNCSLSPEQIASRIEPSIVKVFYRNEPGHGTGFFVPGEKGVCTVLTAAHVVKKEGKNALQTNDGEVWDVAKVEIFPIPGSPGQKSAVESQKSASGSHKSHLRSQKSDFNINYPLLNIKKFYGHLWVIC